MQALNSKVPPARFLFTVMYCLIRVKRWENSEKTVNMHARLLGTINPQLIAGQVSTSRYFLTYVLT